MQRPIPTMVGKPTAALSSAALFIEDRVFPAVFFCYSFYFAAILSAIEPRIAAACGRFLRHNFSLPDIIYLTSCMQYAVLVPFNFLIGWSLLVRKRIPQQFQTSTDIIIPLAASASYLGFNVIPSLTQAWNIRFVQGAAVLPLGILGAALSLAGAVISLAGVCSLGTSFAVYAEVRKIVFTGIYRHVRHPIYLGYIISSLGVCLAYPNAASLAMASIATWLTVIRARLEEAKISAVSEEYRQYKERTPFM